MSRLDAEAFLIVGKESNIYPLSSVRGFVPAGSIYKKQGDIIKKY